MLYAETMGYALLDIYLMACGDASPHQDCYRLLDYDDPVLLTTLADFSILAQVYESQLNDVAAKYGIKRSN